MAQPTEFDIVGATYYAVAPAGYSYSSEQNTNYDTRKYNTLSAAEAALPSTLTTPCVINIIGDWTGVDDSTAVTFDGVSMSVANYVLARTIGEARHNGVYDDTGSFYRLKLANSSVLQIYDDYVRIDGLQINKTASNAGNQDCVSIIPNGGAGAADIRISNCIILGANNSSYTENGIEVWVGDNEIVYIWNTMVYNIHTTAGVTYAILSWSGTALGEVYVYNCTTHGGWDGIGRATGVMTVKNCYSGGAGNKCYSGTMTMVTCASSDSTGSAGLQSIAYDTSTFVNVTSGLEDHNLPVGSPLIGVATNTSGDDPPLNFNDDMIGKER